MQGHWLLAVTYLENINVLQTLTVSYNIAKGLLDTLLYKFAHQGSTLARLGEHVGKDLICKNVQLLLILSL